jgi:hypothetical protein
MSEEIKTILTADSSVLAAEFAKASAIAQKYANDRAAEGGRALAAVRAEVEALRMQSDGFGNIANSMRASNALREQALRLSTQAGITEDKATAILREKQLLQQNIAIAAERQVAAATRAARIAAPGRSGISLPEIALTAANLQAMEKMQFRATEIRKSMNQPSSKMGGAMGLMAVSAAIDDVQYGFKGVINNIPQAVMAFGGFSEASMALAARLGIYAVAGYAAWNMGKKLAGDDEVEAWATAQAAAVKTAADALEKYQKVTQIRRFKDESQREANKEMERGNSIIQRRIELDKDYQAARERAQAALARRRSGEDQIISAASSSGLYASSKVIGATRSVEDKRSAEDVEAIQKRLNDLGKQWQIIYQEGGAIAGDYARKHNEISAQYEKEANTLNFLLSKEAELKSYLDEKNKEALNPRQAAIFKRDLQNIQKQIEESEKLTITQKDRMVVLDQLAKKATEESKKSIEAIRQQQMTQREKLDQIKEEASLREQIRAIQDAARARAAADYKKELALQQAIAANDLDRVRTLERQRDIEAEKRRLMAEQKGLTEKDAATQAERTVDTRAAAAAAPARKAAARAAGQNTRAGQLREAATLEQQILSIMRAQNITRAEATKQAKERQDLERKASRGDIIAEMKALKMEAAGDKSGANRLREEVRIRAEAVALAEKLGITENSAQSLLREKARLEKQISDQEKEKTRRRGSIYTLTPEEQQRRNTLAPTGLITGGLTTGGLRPSELDRRAQIRSNRPLTPSDQAAKTLLRSVNIQEEMLKIWQKLNVV